MKRRIPKRTSPARVQINGTIVGSVVNLRKAYRMTQPPKVEHENEEAYIVKKGKWV